MKFSISQQQKLKYFKKPMLVVFLLDILIIAILAIFYSATLLMYLEMLIVALLAQCVLFYIPMAIFYFNYLKEDKKKVLTIRPNERVFEFKNGNSIESFEEKEIIKAVFHMSLPKVAGRPIWLYWLDFFYVKIFTTKGDFIVTCLLCDTIEEYLPTDKIEKKGYQLAHAVPK